MWPQERGSKRAPRAQVLPAWAFSWARGLIPSGKKFAWLALGQPPPSSRLPFSDTFLENSPRAWPAAHSHLSDVMIRCSWNRISAGTRGATLTSKTEILQLGQPGAFPLPLRLLGRVSLSRSAGAGPGRAWPWEERVPAGQGS